MSAPPAAPAKSPQVPVFNRRDACRHLGLATDNTAHRDFPSTEQRCYLWNQQEEVDVRHQREFCLTREHHSCPWLTLPPRGAASVPGAWRAALGRVVGIVLIVAAVVFVAGFLFVHRPASPPPVNDGSPVAKPCTDSSADGSSRSAVLASRPLSASLLSGGNPAAVTAAIPAAADCTVVAGNLGVYFPANAFAGWDGPLSLTIESSPTGVPAPSGPWQVSNKGTIIRFVLRDADGNPVTTSPVPVTVMLRYSTDDLAIAGGQSSLLTAGYVIDNLTAYIANPLGLPSGTWVYFPPSVTREDGSTGIVTVLTQSLPSILGVVTRPFNFVSVNADQTPIWSSFGESGQQFGARQKSTLLQVVGPQIGGRMLVLDPQTKNYGYVDSQQVSPAQTPS